MFLISWDDFIAGWIAGISGTAVGHPIETIKVRQQAFGTKFMDAATRTYKYEGVPGFFKGIVFPVMTVGPSNAILFGVYANLMHMQQGSAKIDHSFSYTDTKAIRSILIAGTLGGFLQTIFLCPSEVIKTVLQAKTAGRGSWRKHYEAPYEGSIEALKGFYRDRGLKGFYRGLTPLLLRDVPISGVYILTYEMLMYHSFSQFTIPTVIKRIIAGGTAGLLSWCLVFPLDLVKNRMQVDDPVNPQYKNTIDCFVKSYRAEGFSVFFRGAPALLFRSFPVNAVTFMGYESALSIFRESFV